MNGENKKNSNLMSYSIALAMIIFTLLSFGVINDNTDLGIVMFLNILLYFLVIFLYFGIALLAYNHRNNLLWSAGIAAFVIGYLFSGMNNLWQLLTGWSMILFASAIVGRLTFKKTTQLKVYIISMAAVMFFAISLYSPLWSAFMELAGDWSLTFFEDNRQALIAMGYSASEVAESISNIKKVTATVIYLIPSLTVMGAVMQFSIGYVAFLYYLDKKHPEQKRLAPFTHWKVPFAVIPVLLTALVIRFVGSDFVTQIADNVIAIIALYYSITGLSLIEFYIQKFRISRILKIIFYISLFFTQFVGFFAAALLGFIDCFANWRKVKQLGFEKE